MPRNAAVALLEDHDDQFVRSLWGRLATRCGLHGVAACPHPHVSLLGSVHPSGAALDSLDAAVAEFASRNAPVTTRVTGLLSFPGERPVVFLAVEKNDALRALHERFWDFVEAACGLREANPLYRPESWVPHVTVAISDTREGDVERVAEELREFAIERPLVVRTLAMLHQDGPTYRVLRRHLLV